MEPDNLYDPDWGTSLEYNTLEHTVIGQSWDSNTSAVPNNGTWSIINTPINTHTTINGPIHSGEMTVSDGAGGWIKVGEALRRIMDRLAILEPDLEKMERYPALKAAYDNYKIMEALLNEEAAGKK